VGNARPEWSLAFQRRFPCDEAIGFQGGEVSGSHQGLVQCAWCFSKVEKIVRCPWSQTGRGESWHPIENTRFALAVLKIPGRYE
jgi:hypothetical protein